MSLFPLKPSSTYVKAYYAALAQFEKHGHTTEGNTRSAFDALLRKCADTHGIVYTPQPIVDFMARGVDEILQQEFGKSLSDSGVHILDPFTGTRNFITRIMQQIKRPALPQKYAE